MTEAKKPGRPLGSRNKVDVRKDVTRALTTGHNLTSMKEYLEGYITELRLTKADGKILLQALKQHFELVRWMTNLEVEYQEGGKGKKVGSPGASEGSGEDGEEVDDGLVIYDFSKVKK